MFKNCEVTLGIVGLCHNRTYYRLVYFLHYLVLRKCNNEQLLSICLNKTNTTIASKPVRAAYLVS